MVDVAAHGGRIFIDRFDVIESAGLIVDLLEMPVEGVVHTEHGVVLPISGRHYLQIQHIDGIESMGTDNIVDGVIDVTALGLVQVGIFTPIVSFIGADRSVKLEPV